MKSGLVVRLLSLTALCCLGLPYAAGQNPPLPPRPQGPEQASKKADLPRTLVLDARKLSTLQKELDGAAAAGYRVEAATVDAQEIGAGVTSTTGKSRTQGNTESYTETSRTTEVTVPLDEMKVTLSKATEPPDTYEYKLVAAFRARTMEKELNELATRGFRLMPDVMLQKATMLGAPELVLMMEKAPKTAERYTYLVLATDRESTLRKETDQAIKEGFVLRGATMFNQRLAFMEKTIEK